MNILKTSVAALFAIGLFTLAPQLAKAQCDSDVFIDNCNKKLSNGYTFLKSYTIDGNKKKSAEFSYVFSKGTNYLLTLCDENGAPQNLYVRLFDSGRNQVFTSKVGDKYLPVMGYKCQATGIYYLTFTFEDGGGKCGGSVLAFKR